MQLGDALYEINRQAITSVAEARKCRMIGELKPGDAVVLLVERDGHLMYIPLETN